MSTTVIQAISDIPVIVQGALGSALFALFMYVGQAVTRWAREELSKNSNTRRQNYLIEERLKYELVISSESSEKAASIGILTFRALRNVIKGLILICLGLIASTIMAPMAWIAYVWGLFYLFDALSSVSAPKEKNDFKAQIKRIDEELESLQSKNSKK